MSEKPEIPDLPDRHDEQPSEKRPSTKKPATRTARSKTARKSVPVKADPDPTPTPATTTGESEPVGANRERRSDRRTVAQKKLELLDALVDALGLALFACRRADVDYDDYLRWRENDPEFARRVDAVEERALDFVEGKAFEEIRKGNARLIQFYLQTKGRKRGFDRSAPSSVAATAEPKKEKPDWTEFLTEDELNY